MSTSTSVPAAASSTNKQATKALQALEHTRLRVEELYKQERNEYIAEDSDDAAKKKLYTAETAIDEAWLPNDTEKFGLPVMYRDMARNRDATFVKDKFHGITEEVFASLDLQSAMLLKFVVLRDLDVETAAARFLAFRHLVIKHDLVWSFEHPDVRRGLACGAFHFIPVFEPRLHRPCVSVYPARIDWKQYGITEIRRAWFFGMMTALMWSPTAQTAGIVLTNSFKGVGLSSLNSEFRDFLSQAINHALPVRIAAVFIANEPFIFGSILWPLFKNFLSQKIRDRMLVIGSNHKKVLEALPAYCVPAEMSGERPDDDAEAHRALNLYKYNGEPATSAAAADEEDNTNGASSSKKSKKPAPPKHVDPTAGHVGEDDAPEEEHAME